MDSDGTGSRDEVHEAGKMDPKTKCWTTGSFDSTSTLYILARPSLTCGEKIVSMVSSSLKERIVFFLRLLTLCHEDNSEMSFSTGECSAKGAPVLTL